MAFILPSFKYLTLPKYLMCCCHGREVEVYDDMPHEREAYAPIEDNAKTDEDNAKTDEDNAKTDEDNAKTDEDYVTPIDKPLPEVPIKKLTRKNTVSLKESISMDSDALAISKDFAQGFAVGAKVLISLEYKHNTLNGSIQLGEGLSFDDPKCPEEICFHINVSPQNKFRAKTTYVQVSKDAPLLELSFVIGLASGELDANSQMRFRMYGKRQKRSRVFCYGECFIPLNSAIESGELIQFEQYIGSKRNDGRLFPRITATID